MKRKIKVQFTDWMKDQKFINGAEYKNFVLAALQKYYDVEISDHPDYVFFNMLGRGYDYKQYDCIRIFCCIEENFPNFNICDYAITLYQGLEYYDRVFSETAIILTEEHKKNHDLALIKHDFTKEELEKKSGFCSFVQSSVIPTTNQREIFFQKLSEYKKVDAGGRSFNNIGRFVEDKIEFEKNYKFSISFYNGESYTLQDRPTDAFAAKSIPIFWGNPQANLIFNRDAYINCHDYADFDEVIEKIKEIDSNDELYLKMMQTPAFLHPESAETVQLRFEQFLINIVENGTKCRSGGMHNKREEEAAYHGKKYIFRKYGSREMMAFFLQRVFWNYRKTRLGVFVKKILLKEYYKR